MDRRRYYQAIAEHAACQISAIFGGRLWECVAPSHDSQNAVMLSQRRLDSFALTRLPLFPIHYGGYQACHILSAGFCRTLLFTGMIRRTDAFI
jgi:hypothetical protein